MQYICILKKTYKPLQQMDIWLIMNPLQNIFFNKKTSLKP